MAMGVLRELDDERHHGKKSKNTSPRTLVDTSAMVLVKDLRAIEQAVKCLPAELYEPLMRACVLGRHLLVARQLVWRWPFRVLNFKKLLPRDDPESCVQLKNAFSEYDKCVGGIIVRTIAEMKNKKLKVVDIRDFDIDHELTNTIGLFAAKPMLDKGQSHGGEKLAKLAEKAINRETLREPPHKDPLILHVDCVVNQENVGVVTLAMAVHRISPISLKCAKLDAYSLGFMKLPSIIRSLDPQYCRGVNLHMNSLECSGILNLLPDLQKLTKLEALGLSYNLLDLTKINPVTERTRTDLPETLRSFEHLRRLDISNNRIGGFLQQLIGNLKNPLQYLDVNNCQLTISDLSYLSTSVHSSQFHSLDLSGNNLARNPDVLFKLVQNGAKTLEFLSMNKCQLHLINDVGTRLSHSLSNCENLKTLTLTDNYFDKELCMAVIRSCSHSNTIGTLYISVPCDLWDEDGFEADGRCFYDEVQRLPTLAVSRSYMNCSNLYLHFENIDT